MSSEAFIESQISKKKELIDETKKFEDLSESSENSKNY